jgi:hypothetical protein
MSQREFVFGRTFSKKSGVYVLSIMVRRQAESTLGMICTNSMIISLFSEWHNVFRYVRC